ncbi:unnamed protein product [Spirodela intermedia]|uniref:Protein kinase domain-containing protein n=1 Tax=Spirodela intermedia TaxID=51605 RepID=A0A7I8IV40_SPIIN|nr:unnamed protein product [Spirodela intermedia]CAA6661433.1 unnamed protein product [Spirodela intermedia]
MPPPFFRVRYLFFLSFFSSALAVTPSPAAAPTVAPGGSADALALLALKSAVDPDGRLPFNRTPRWPYAHCRWEGVRCSTVAGEWRVTHLVLEGLHLRGRFPAAALGSLGQLRLLSLKNNSLSGPVGDLSNLTDLKALFLDHNRLSGGFPLSILLLRRLRTLDLSHNALSGRLPAAIASDLARLYCLRLEFNRFTGPLPPFNQSSLMVLNVSGNDFSGPIPTTAILLSFDPSAFSGNPGLCGKAVKRECRNTFFFFGSPAAAPVPSSAGRLMGILLPEGESSTSSLSATCKKHRRIAAAVGFVAGAVLLIGLVALCAAARRRQRRVFLPQKMSSAAMPDDAMEMCHADGNTCNGGAEGTTTLASAAAAAMMSEEKVKRMGKSGGLVFCAEEEKTYTLEQLMRASADMMGRGSVGTTYKAALTDQLTVSVKRGGLRAPHGGGGAASPPQPRSLRAYFQAKEERLLVYDYQPNGSLFSLIHGSKSARSKPFHWTSCLKIAEDVAQGLAYIHQASRLVHGNIRSSNVLLGDDFEARLVDSCLALLVEPTAAGEGDAAYRAPEMRGSDGRLTAKSDIYAFGVLMLELLSGKPPPPTLPSPADELPAWVRSAREDDAVEDERVMMLLGVAVACVRASPDSRPTAWQVLRMLQEVKEADADDEADVDAAGGS